MSKFLRKYKFVSEANEDSSLITIEPPFTIAFHIMKNNSSSSNTGSFQIYNLNKNTRAQIFQDFWEKKKKHISFSAGYGTELTEIFKGSVRTADSYRQGQDIITSIECFDGGQSMANSNYKDTLSNIYISELLAKLAKSMDDCDGIGVMSKDIQGYITKPVSLDGNTWELIKTYFGETAFFDFNKVNFLKDNECLKGEIALIDSSTGLLGTPRRGDANVEMDILFEPKIKLGQFLEVKSDIQPQYNGQYKVNGFTHSGIISEAVNGSCTTKISLMIGTSRIGGLQIVL